MTSRDIELIRRLIRDELHPIKAWLQGMVMRVELARLDDSTGTQGVQVSGLEGEALPAERLQPFGLASSPPAGAQGVVIAPAGRREESVLLMTDDRRSRPIGLAAGDVVLYDAHGSRISLVEAGIVAVPAAGKSVQLGEAGLTALNGAVHGQAIDPLTGLTYAALGAASSTVFVKP